MTKKEILEDLIQKIKHEFPNSKIGLCFYVFHYLDSDLLLAKEILALAKPKWYERRFYCNKGVFYRKIRFQKAGSFYWDPYNRESRIKWLEKQLKKLENEK